MQNNRFGLGMTMKSARYRTLIRRIALGSIAVLSVTGVLAFRRVFDRPAEGALHLIPADALMVATVDMVPSPGQTLAFKHIDDTLAKHDVQKFMERGITSLLEPGPIAEELNPYLTRSAAVALFSMSEKGSGVVLYAVNDPAAVSAWLKKKAKPKFYKGLAYYQLPNGKSSLLMIENFLAFGSDALALSRIVGVKAGTEPSITTVAEAMNAENQIAPDANVKVIMSPKIAEQSKTKLPVIGYLSMGLAIRDEGLEFTTNTRLDTADSAISKFANISPINPAVTAMLPKGAYGFVSLSQPSTYWSAGTSALDQQGQGDAKKQMEKSIQDGLGLSMEDDVMPAIQGTVTLALYPNENELSGVNAVAIFDDSNGANAAPGFEKFRAFAVKQAGNDKPGKPIFVKSQDGDATVYRLSPQVEKDFRESMHGNPQDIIEYSKVFDEKTATWAIIGKSVIAATSPKLLARTLGQYRSKEAAGSLAQDSAYALVSPSISGGSQAIVTFDLARIAKGIDGTLKPGEAKSDARKTARTILDMFENLKTPMAVTMHVVPNGDTASKVIVPIDYEKLFDFIGTQVLKKK
jgi:Protein of unknown function (DUF3352)